MLRRSLFLSLLLVMGCSADESQGGETQGALASRESILGSWTIEQAPSPGGALGLPHRPYRTLAGLVLRDDGTFFAQVAPREITSTPDRYVTDDHMDGMRDGIELVGIWQGIEGKFTIEESGVLRLERRAPDGGLAMPLLLNVTRTDDELVITRADDSTKVDKLRRREDDCRTKAVVRTDDERTTDALIEEVMAIGGKNEPTSIKISLEGDIGENRCASYPKGSALRVEARDEAGVLRAITRTVRVDDTTHVAQLFAYDARGGLRAIVTTTERERLAPTSLTERFGPLLTVEQTRTYFDASGREGRTLVQPHVEEAQIVAEETAFTGRRYRDLHEAVSIADLAWCVGQSAAVFAAHPSNREATQSEPPVCGAR